MQWLKDHFMPKYCCDRHREDFIEQKKVVALLTLENVALLTWSFGRFVGHI